MLAPMLLQQDVHRYVNTMVRKLEGTANLFERLVLDQSVNQARVSNSSK